MFRLAIFGVEQAAAHARHKAAQDSRSTGERIMKEATKRSIFRWIHIVCGMPMIGYIYDSPSDTRYYAPIVRYIFLPVLLLSGLWMWKGHVVRRLLRKRSAGATGALANL